MQFIMCTPLCNAAFFQYNNLIGRYDGRQAVCDNDDRFFLNQLPDGKLHFVFILRIGKGSRFVEYQDRGVLQYCACYGYTLLFAS